MVSRDCLVRLVHPEIRDPLAHLEPMANLAHLAAGDRLALMDPWVHLDLWACLVLEVLRERKENVDHPVSLDPLDLPDHLESLLAMMLPLCLLCLAKDPPRVPIH